MAKTPLNANQQTDPGFDMVAVTQSDTVADPAGPFRGIFIGVAGILKFTTLGGTDVTLQSGELAVGVIHPIRVARVWSTITTATAIYGIT